MITTAQTLKVLAALGSLTFRPMTTFEHRAYADATPEAQIARGDAEFANLLCDLTGQSVMTEGDDMIVVIVDGFQVVVEGMEPDGSPVALFLDLKA